MQCRDLEPWVLMFLRDCFVGLMGDVFLRVSVDVINTIVRNNLKDSFGLPVLLRGAMAGTTSSQEMKQRPWRNPAHWFGPPA